MVDQRETDPIPGLTARQVAAGLAVLFGLNGVVGGLAHIQGVMRTAQVRGYPYDFRYASLLIVGLMVVFSGVLYLWAMRGLLRGQVAAWERAVIGTLLLVLVSAPLLPYESPGRDNAVTTLIPAVALLIGLLVTRRRLVADEETSHSAPDSRKEEGADAADVAPDQAGAFDADAQ